MISDHEKISVISDHGKINVISDHGKISVISDHGKIKVISHHGKMRFIYVAFKNVAGRVINVTRTLIAGANCVCPIEFEVSTRDEITIVLSNMFMKYFFFHSRLPLVQCQ